ncbi:MAG: lysozyme inhibitor LprI family protein [Acidobacteriota bacterium]
MPLRTCIPTALLLIIGATLIAPAQNPTPAQNPAPPAAAPKNAQSSANPAPPPEYTDPCEANAMTVDFDTCYADQFKLTDQDLNHLYRNALLAFEADIADAHKRGDQSQLSYDATAIGNLRAAQAAWTKYRDLQCRAAGQQLQGGSIQPIVVNKCMILVTRHRIDDIRAAYEIGGRNLE